MPVSRGITVIRAEWRTEAIPRALTATRRAKVRLDFSPACRDHCAPPPLRRHPQPGSDSSSGGSEPCSEEEEHSLLNELKGKASTLAAYLTSCVGRPRHIHRPNQGNSSSALDAAAGSQQEGHVAQPQSPVQPRRASGRTRKQTVFHAPRPLDEPDCFSRCCFPLLFSFAMLTAH